MSSKASIFSELKRRNVYKGADTLKEECLESK